jgi:hexokinase
MVAVILGTGTNACYIEKNDFIPKLRHLGPVTGNTVCFFSEAATQYAAISVLLCQKKYIVPNRRINIIKLS